MIIKWDELPLVLTTKQAADVMNVDIRHIYRLTRTETFPCIRISNTIRIPRDAYRAWLEQGKYQLV